MDLNFQCRCGTVKGQVRSVEEHGLRMICLCDDCQAYAHWLEKPNELLDANGGTDIVAFRPRQVHFSQGESQVFCLRLSENGLLRFYAACCKTPIGNQINNARLPYVGFFLSTLYLGTKPSIVDSMVGPSKGRIMGRFGIPPLPPGTSQKAPLSLFGPIILYLLSGFIKGAHKPSPFFKSGKLVIDTRTLGASERDSLRKYCGPSPSVKWELGRGE